MTFEEISRELVSLLPDQFEETEEKEFNELKKMAFSKGFNRLYAKKSPIDSISIGKFNLLRLQDLINENIWDSPGEDLYEIGLPIVGNDANGNLYCLNVSEKNKLDDHDVLLADPDEDYSGLTTKEARKKMKYVNESLEGMLTRELEFLRKNLRKKA